MNKLAQTHLSLSTEGALMPAKKRMTRAEGRNAPGFRISDHEGDSGPVECTLTFDEWARTTGYNPDTGRYDLEPEDVEPAIVLQQHNPNRRDTRAQAAQRSASDGSDFDWPAGPDAYREVFGTDDPGLGDWPDIDPIAY